MPARDIACVSDAVAALGDFGKNMDVYAKVCDAAAGTSSVSMTSSEEERAPCPVTMRIRSPRKRPPIQLSLRVREPRPVPVRIKIRPPAIVRFDGMGNRPRRVMHEDTFEDQSDLPQKVPIRTDGMESNCDDGASRHNYQHSRQKTEQCHSRPWETQESELNEGELAANSKAEFSPHSSRDDTIAAKNPDKRHLQTVFLRLRVRQEKKAIVGDDCTERNEPTPQRPEQCPPVTNRNSGKSNEVGPCRKASELQVVNSGYTPSRQNLGGAEEASYMLHRTPLGGVAADDTGNATPLPVVLENGRPRPTNNIISLAPHVDESVNADHEPLDVGSGYERHLPPDASCVKGGSIIASEHNPYFIGITSLRTDLEMELAEELVSRLGGEITTGFRESALPSCVVTSLNSHTKAIENRTMALHEALARRVPIVGLSWLVECFKAGMWLDTREFEAPSCRHREKEKIFRGVIATFDHAFDAVGKPS